jgi:hypothetical protein
MNAEFPQREDFPTFQEYKQNKEVAYSADRLSHYFNNELGTASNLIASLRSRISSSSGSSDVISTMLSEIDKIAGHLATVHEIGNISIDLLLRGDTEE